MKNVFSVDMTNNPDNERIDGVQFITQTLDQFCCSKWTALRIRRKNKRIKRNCPLCCAFCAALLVYVRSFASAAL